jgi:hypothetical protein
MLCDVVALAESQGHMLRNGREVVVHGKELVVADDGACRDQTINS